MLLDFHVITGTVFSLRDKRLFEISRIEIAIVDCIAITLFTQATLRPFEKIESYRLNIYFKCVLYLIGNDNFDTNALKNLTYR